MKICEKCGKEIHSYNDYYTRLDVPFCESCAFEYDKLDETEKSAVAAKIKKKAAANSIIEQADSKWIKAAKILAVIKLIAELIAGVPLAILVSDLTGSYANAILAFVVLALIAATVFALIMVFLNMAKDISILKAFKHRDFMDKDK